MDDPLTGGAPEILEVRGLRKSYPYGAGEVRALDGVGFTLKRGEFVAVMGASGSGKSSLLHLIAGLTAPDEGKVEVAGEDLFAMNDYRRTRFRRERIGLIFQAFNLIPDLSGRDNILLPSLLGGLELPEGEPDGVIEHLGIRGCCERRPDAMSGGEQQRVAIARALVTRPVLLLADEPSGNLDTANSDELCHLLKKQCGLHRTAVLMVTHNPAVAFTADRVLLMRDGRIVEDEPRERFADAAALGAHFAEAQAGEVSNPAVA